MFVVDSVEPDDGVDGFEIAFSPRLEFWQQFVSDSVQRAVRQLDAVKIFDVGADVLITVSKRIECEHFAFKIVGEMGLVLFDKLRVKVASAISGCVQLEATSG